ncbi:S8 family serine peptidase [Nonomuraea sp. NN258]|uniref:S8 family serine peptidase n=1 Tax=Nonomuraea antri TaxID=2730852 RepID=UPI00156980B6|nr:S8 family serine peptidase [Nonomuraea antri]NRQ37082.1 S8 family serine peptidase [Nonomuraea antri]
MIFSKFLAAAVLAAGAVTAVHSPAAPAPPGVTLITGDRVVVTGPGHRVEPGPGRAADFTAQVRDGHLFVFPSDALPLIAQGVLDSRLFDVTQLLAWGYGDADRTDIPVISQGAAVPGVAARERRLSTLGMSAARVPKSAAASAWRELTGTRTLAAGRAKLWLDGRRSFSLNESVAQIGAPRAWERGLTGQGVTVAVLDSGYDATHPAFKDAVAYERNFSDEPDMRDDLGHGTHVASIVAGRGEKYRGVAPAAKLAIGKVGGPAGPTDSAILAGMEWAAVEVKAKVVNLSFGDRDGPGLDPLEQAVNTLSERTGTLFVAGAGNDGGPGTVISPGSAEAALTVGAVDKQGRMADFSSRGPRVGDHAIKPEITAPGVAIMAAAAEGTADGPYVALDGTSMATPHVAGAAAILAQRHPEWTGGQLKAALIGSAAPAANATPYQQGAGLVDLGRAVEQQVVATQGAQWAAFPWGDAGERTATRTITYANAGDTPVTLELSAQGEVLKLPAGRVDVPAKGRAQVTLTIDATGKSPGDYPGTVTARAGENVIRTLAGAYVEPESATATITVIGRNGTPVTPTSHQIYDAETGEIHLPAFRDGVATIRLPNGEWNLYTETRETVGGKRITTIADTPFTIGAGDREVSVDNRLGKPARMTVDDPDAVLRRGFEQNLAHGAWNVSGSTGSMDVNSQLFVVPVRLPCLTYQLAAQLLSKDVSPSPYVYDLVDQHADGIPDDPAYDARRAELAKVSVTYRASAVAATGTPLSGRRVGGVPVISLHALVRDIPLPGALVHYRSPGVLYESGLDVGTSSVFAGGEVMRRGETGEVWNTAVTGPSVLLPAGGRSGDRLTFSAAGLLADGGAGRSGFDTAATGVATLAGDGRVLARADLSGCAVYQQEGCRLTADLPAGSGAYTLSASLRREVAHSALSTRVESVWTFTSGGAARPQPLPLLAVRYQPAGLDAWNRARKGGLTRLPFHVERTPGAAHAEIRSVRLEMSADDGANWRRVPVVRAGTGWTALLPDPRTAGFVSLRAMVRDTAGAGVTQTIIRAYAVG